MKLTNVKENVQYNDNEWIRPLYRYYFRTVEDSNNDGFFDIKDKIHHYYIEFKDQGYRVVEYDPLKEGNSEQEIKNSKQNKCIWPSFIAN
ncbi:MAG: hypothetical protein LBL79_00380 [Prevotella sp.]|nr:hypothetical protein [Prevotella sp.]